MAWSFPQLTGHDKVVPARRILERDAFDAPPSGVLRVEEDWSQIRIIRVQNLVSSKLVPPFLAIAVQHALAVDSRIIPAPFPKHDYIVCISLLMCSYLLVVSLVGKEGAHWCFERDVCTPHSASS